MTILKNKYIIRGHNYCIDNCLSTINFSLLYNIF